MIDNKIRLKAFEWLDEQVKIHGDVLPRGLLERGFQFEDHIIPLVSPQGIFKPKMLDIPLSITTAPNSKYDDGEKNGFISYKYRGTDIYHRDNAGLREALNKNVPLIYFLGIVPGKYLAEWPVYIIGDDPKDLTFTVAVDDKISISNKTMVAENSNSRRAYITSIVKSRLHQRSFRERVLDAYRSQCAFCRLKHLELLDAAHIVPDSDPNSKSIVENGIALCKLHHAAFDKFILGISPDYIIKVRQDILDETDGPMLQHGLKDLDNSKIVLPKNKILWPKREFLNLRYELFRKAS